MCAHKACQRSSQQVRSQPLSFYSVGAGEGGMGKLAVRWSGLGAGGGGGGGEGDWSISEHRSCLSQVEITPKAMPAQRSLLGYTMSFLSSVGGSIIPAPYSIPPFFPTPTQLPLPAHSQRGAGLSGHCNSCSPLLPALRYCTVGVFQALSTSHVVFVCTLPHSTLSSQVTLGKD